MSDAAWFERMTGFREGGYADTQTRLEVDGERLRSRVNGRSWAIGRLETPTLAELRLRVRKEGVPRSRLDVLNMSEDVRSLHRDADFEGALFQVASQFNLLEMTGPDITPEDGVTRYAFDRTQGPACALAAAPATLYRNYFAPVGGQVGQTASRQLDTLADLGGALSRALERPACELWTMRNGYALCSAEGLEAIASHIEALSEPERDHLRAELRIGLHWDVEVSDGEATPGPTVSQAFCSALPVAYCHRPMDHWRPFATLVLEAAYEATLLAAILNARRGRSRKLVLTRLGGGAFGNDGAWIDRAMERALEQARAHDLEVVIVSFGAPPASMLRLAERLMLSV